MPWKAKSPMDLRKEFINRLAQKERLTDLCREYGISRKTGSKFKRRFEQLGVAGLADQSRAPQVIPHKTPPEVEAVIIAERMRHPTWGPKKLKEALERRLESPFPSAAAIGGVLSRNGLVKARKRRAAPPAHADAASRGHGTERDLVHRLQGPVPPRRPNYCYPLTITDQFSRFILGCEGMAGAISERRPARSARRSSARSGSHRLCRSDNGVPLYPLHESRPGKRGCDLAAWSSCWRLLRYGRNGSKNGVRAV